ncbi:MAG: M6 family metalloprotease domain-containing protein [Bacteroidales bacterium]|nr:M6 family metalloprotease domain-containing protein [Bacteroidales bacterium]
MKKLLVLLAAGFFCLEMGAVPAMPGHFLYKQPDGSVIRLQRHGDEFFSWTTLAGTSQVVILGTDGFWKKGRLSESARAAAERERAHANEIRRQNAPRTHSANVMTHGERHIPVILVAFQDVAFTVSDPQSHFNNLLNQHGYSENGGTGSVQDYYLENSDGQFKPIFDVYGPVMLPHDMKYYGEPVKDSEGNIIRNDIRPADALIDGCDLLDDLIDFTRYDYDKDGYVDMTLFYYAGYNTAEGGSEDAIWPHQSGLGNRGISYDGKKMGRYFCTSELRGNSGATPCPIGTTCHEFGHSLGLPDFYDTNYEKNGECMGLGVFSLMASGSYNNAGCTPPYFNTEERIILNWMTREDVLPLPSGPTSLGPVRNSVAYYSETSTEGEYFLYECRDGLGWDTFIPAGLLVFHVDKSKEHIVGGISAYNQWAQWTSYNTINAYGSHPCFYVVPSADQKNLYYRGGAESMVFPGSAGIHSYIPSDWSENNPTGIRLSDIQFADGKVSFTTSVIQSRLIAGRVEDLNGNAVEGVFVQLSEVEASPASLSLRKAAPRRIDYEAVTDDKGDFFLALEGFDNARGHLTLSKVGYRTMGYDVELDKSVTHTRFTLHRRDQGELRNYSYYDPSAGYARIWTYDYNDSQMAAIRIPAEEIPSAGVLNSVSFPPLWEADHYYVVVDRGEERLFTTEVFPTIIQENNTFNLSSHKVVIEPGSDVYVGIAIDHAHPWEGYDNFLFFITPTGNNCYGSPFSLTGSSWDPSTGTPGLVLDVEIVEKLEGGEDPAEPGELAQMGIPSIADPSCGQYAVGSSFQLQLDLPEGMTPAAEEVWLFDGAAVTGAKSVTLTAGKHVVTARVKWPDGSQETMALQIDVK